MFRSVVTLHIYYLKVQCGSFFSVDVCYDSLLGKKTFLLTKSAQRDCFLVSICVLLLFFRCFKPIVVPQCFMLSNMVSE